MFNYRALIITTVAVILLAGIGALMLAVVHHNQLTQTTERLKASESENVTWQFVQLRSELRDLHDELTAFYPSTTLQIFRPAQTRLGLAFVSSRFEGMNILLTRLETDAQDARVPPLVMERFRETHNRFRSISTDIRQFADAPTIGQQQDVLQRLDALIAKTSTMASMMLQLEQRHGEALHQTMVENMQNYERTMFLFALLMVLFALSLGALLRNEAHINAELAAAVDRATKAANAKSMFMSSMSHELRTPLNAIAGFSQLIAMGLPDEKRQTLAPYAQAVDDSVRSLVQLIDQILDFDQMSRDEDTLQLRTTTGESVLNAALAIAGKWHPQPNIDICFESAGTGLKLTTDPDKLQLLLGHLISNAMKFNYSDGEVVLIVKDEGEHVLFEVKDTGIGVAPEKAPLLFRPFERLGLEAGNISGSGTGLAICKLLSTRLHGTIGYTPREAGGSVFWVRVPKDLMKHINDAVATHAIAHEDSRIGVGQSRSYANVA